MAVWIHPQAKEIVSIDGNGRVQSLKENHADKRSLKDQRREAAEANRKWIQALYRVHQQTNLQCPRYLQTLHNKVDENEVK